MPLDSFLTSALLILIVTSVAVALFKHLGLGSVLGLLVAGIIVGPYSPGPYVTEHVEDVRHFTELGIVFLLFIIGLDMKPGRLWAMRREVLGLGTLQILISGVLIGFYFLLFQSSWQVAFLIGMAFALSSTAFVLQLLQERGEIASKHGRVTFSILLMQDLAIVPLLALVPIMSVTGTLSADVPLWEQFAIVIGILLLISAFAKLILPQALTYLAKKRNKEGFLLTVLLTVLLAAWAMQKAGMSMALGAFVMGMFLSGSHYRLQIQASIEPFKGIMMSLFFLAVGMSIDISALAAEPGIFLQHTIVIIVIKLLVVFVLALIFGYPKDFATRVSFFLAQGGEFGFVLFSAANVLQVIDDRTFVHAIGVISISMLVTPLLVRLGDRLANKMGPVEQKYYDQISTEDTEMQRKVVIGGYGRVGHTVAMLMEGSGIPTVIFDTDPERVAQGIKDGLNVYFGDIGDPHLLTGSQIERALLVVLTIDNGPAVEEAVAHIRNDYPDMPIVARARDLEACGRLLEAGATHAFPEAVESSLRLGSIALEMVNIPHESIDQLMSGVRSTNYELVEQGTEKKESD